MIEAKENFNNTWPFKANFFSGNGFKQHYVDEGKENKKVILCLHGEPTWGYIYRHFIRELSKDFRVVVPDLMGFGKSETPKNKEYSLKTHVENLENLVNYLELENIYFVGQDWGGPILGAYTLRNLKNTKGMFLINTILGYSRTEKPKELTPWFKWIKKNEENGTLEVLLGELNTTILSIMKILNFTNSSIIDDNWIKAYASPFPNRDSCLGAINFPLDVLHGRMVPFIISCLKNGDMKSFLEIPAELVYGMKDRAIDPDYAINDFKALYPNSKITKLKNAGHFSQEDEPYKIIELIKEFVSNH